MRSRFKINSLLLVGIYHFLSKIKDLMVYQVPPIIIAMKNNEKVVKKFDLTSVESVFTGAAPLGAEIAEALQAQHPTWKIRQGYGKFGRALPTCDKNLPADMPSGLTETSTVVCSTSEIDIWFGTCGSVRFLFIST
jgi:acyl-CoA synthetase (AMP-forming)/AMP-acid ligase II